MLQLTIEGEDEGIGYIVMKADPSNFSAGSGVVEIGTFADMERFTIGSDITSMDAAQAINTREISVVL